MTKYTTSGNFYFRIIVGFVRFIGFYNESYFCFKYERIDIINMWCILEYCSFE